MPVSLEQFIKQLEESGLLSADTLQEFVAPQASPKDAEDLARELVRRKKLTKFQVTEVSRGNGRALVLGNYTILEKIGAGGMGQVFKAEHRRMKRIVAVKMLPPAMTKKPALVARFEREVTAAARLNHPNIVAAFDADKVNGLHLLVMEYVEGKDLSALVKNEGPFDVDKAADCILQAARGLEAAHAEGIVHRDIKPANLLLDKEGTVKILDMGLARFGEVTNAQAELTNTGAVMGTIDYMAPEQAESSKSADARADIYSLGCTLHFLLTGKALYEGATLMAKLLAHRDKPIPSLRARCPAASDGLEAVFRKMVAKRADERYQTARELIVDERGDVSQPAEELESDPFAEAGLTGISSEEAPIVGGRRRVRPAESRLDKNRNFVRIGGAVVAALIVSAGLAITFRSGDGDKVVTTEPAPQAKPASAVGRSPDAEVERNAESPPGQPIESVAAKTSTDAEFQRIAALSADQQVLEAATKLKELNPDFDGKLDRKIENDVVTELRINVDDVTDIAPIRVFNGLRVLACTGTETDDRVKSRLADLSPLGGMNLAELTSLDLSRTQVTDNELTHLAACANLTSLNLSRTKVGNAGLAHLRDCRKLSKIHLRSTNVTDLSLLKGFPLIEIAGDFRVERDAAILRSITTLETINDKPAAEFWKEFDPTNIARSPLADSDIRRSNALAADLQVQMLAAKLKDLNPGFDGTVTRKIENGVVTELRIRTDNVTNVAPIRDFGDLRVLDCSGSQSGWRANSTLGDLTPLRGMSFDNLTELRLAYTKVGDAEMEVFRNCRNLVQLDLDGTQVGEAGLEIFKNCKSLKLLGLGGMQVGDRVLAQFKDCKGLTDLNLAATKVTDAVLEHFKGLAYLNLAHTQVTDFGLARLKAQDNLSNLVLESTQVSDAGLTGLRGHRNLKHLDLRQTKVTSEGLALLRGCRKLELLLIGGTQITDLSPLKSLPLKRLYCDFQPDRDTAILRSIKTLETINDRPVAEIWKELKLK